MLDPAPEYHTGDWVFLDASDIKTTCPSSKLAHRYLGPYVVQRRVGQNAYWLWLRPSRLPLYIECSPHSWESLDFSLQISPLLGETCVCCHFLCDVYILRISPLLALCEIPQSHWGFPYSRKVSLEGLVSRLHCQHRYLWNWRQWFRRRDLFCAYSTWLLYSQALNPKLPDSIVKLRGGGL